MTNGNGDRLLHPKFPFGRVVCTPGVLEKLNRAKIDELLRRHGQRDPGTPPDDEDTIHNEFTVDGVGVVWIITEPDRPVTTVLLPSEY